MFQITSIPLRFLGFGAETAKATQGHAPQKPEKKLPRARAARVCQAGSSAEAAKWAEEKVRGQ